MVVASSLRKREIFRSFNLRKGWEFITSMSTGLIDRLVPALIEMPYHGGYAEGFVMSLAPWHVPWSPPAFTLP